MQNKLRSKKTAAACYNKSMSASGHTDSDGAKPRQCRFLFKKLRIGFLVFLALILTVVGAVGSTVRAGGTDTEDGKITYTSDNTWTARYYLKLFYICTSVTLEGAYYADALTIASAWNGGWAPDKNYATDDGHNPKLYADPLLGDRVRCSEVPSLIANTYNSVTKIGGNNGLSWGGTDAPNNQKADFFTSLGFRAWVDEGTNKLYGESSGFSDEKARMVAAHEKGANDEDYVIALYGNTTKDSLKGKLLGMINDSNSNDLAERYYRDYYGVQKSCDIGNGFLTEPPTTDYGQEVIEFPNIVTTANNGGLKLETRYIKTGGRNGGTERNYHFYNLDDFDDEHDHYIPCVGEHALKREIIANVSSECVDYRERNGVKYCNQWNNNSGIVSVDINAEATAALKERLRYGRNLTECAKK